jgi:hypothetical protein
MAVRLESFEKITATANSPPSFRFGDDGYFQPGFISLYTFKSGLKLLEPVPNDNDDSGETLVGEFDTLLEPRWGLVDNGTINKDDDLPHGTAFIGANQEVDGTLTFGFPKDVYVVEAFVDAVRDDATGSRGLIAAAAYDASGNLVAASRILSVPKAEWDENLISLRSNVPIAKVVYTGNFVILDRPTFDDDKPKVIKGTKKDDKIGSAAVGKDTSDDPDLIRAKGGNDKVFGRDGGDTIFGGKGKDKLHGGDDDDTLAGEEGKDKLWGDAGEDSFLFTVLGPVDAIKDFDPAKDSILLDLDTFSGLNPGQLLAALFNDGSVPIDSNDRIMYDSGTGALTYDADGGSGPTKAIVFAKLKPGLDLSAENFFAV